jgi:hypothetical protein
MVIGLFKGYDITAKTQELSYLTHTHAPKPFGRLGLRHLVI